MENIDIDKDNLKNIDIDMAILENIDIDKGILQNIDIDKISYRLGFGISNTPSVLPLKVRRNYIQPIFERMVYFDPNRDKDHVGGCFVGQIRESWRGRQDFWASLSCPRPLFLPRFKGFPAMTPGKNML